MTDTNEKKITGKWHWVVRSGLTVLLVTLVVLGFIFQHFLGHDKIELAQDFAKTVTDEKSATVAPADLALLREMSALASRGEASLHAVTILAIAGENALADHRVSDKERKTLTLLRDFVKRENGAVGAMQLGRLLSENPEIKSLLDHSAPVALRLPQEAASTTATTAAAPGQAKE